MSQKVNELLKEIKENLSQKNASAKDEVTVMQAMLNDKDYSVGVYKGTEKVDEYCPAKDARKMITTVISSATKVSKAEAEQLADKHEFTRAESASMVGISKEFINTYVETGRKLPLGGRAESNVKLQQVEREEREKTYPKKVINADGTTTYDTKQKTVIPAHKSIRVNGSCPSWLKK